MYTINAILNELMDAGQMDLWWAEDYAEPGYSSNGKGILLGNWNAKQRPVRDENGKVIRWEKDPDAFDIERFASLAERAGFEIEWIDEWQVCECGKAFRTSPDSYGWQMYGYLDDGCNFLCGDCISEDPQDYIDDLTNNPDKAIMLHHINPEDFGFVKYNDKRYENGWHRWQTDNPHDIAKELEDKGLDYIFKVPSVGQFDVYFDVYVRKCEDD